MFLGFKTKWLVFCVGMDIEKSELNLKIFITTKYIKIMTLIRRHSLPVFFDDFLTKEVNQEKFIA